MAFAPSGSASASFLPVSLPECDPAARDQVWRMEGGNSGNKTVRLVHASTGERHRSRPSYGQNEISSGKCLDVLIGAERHNRTAFVAPCKDPGGDAAERQMWRLRTDHPFNAL